MPKMRDRKKLYGNCRRILKMCRRNKPVRLEKKEEFNLELSTNLIITMILLIILFAIAIAMAVGCKSPYNMGVGIGMI